MTKGFARCFVKDICGHHSSLKKLFTNSFNHDLMKKHQLTGKRMSSSIIPNKYHFTLQNKPDNILYGYHNVELVMLMSNYGVR